MSSKYFKIYGGIKTAAEAGKKILTTSKAYKNKLQADKVTAAKDKAIGKIKSAKRKVYKKKFGKEPTVTIRYPGGKKETVTDQMIGDKEINRYHRISKAKTWRKR